MTSRGRARGRGTNGGAAGPAAPSAVGGAGAPGPRGRGRSRGLPVACETPPAEQMSAMNVGALPRQERGGVRERGSRYANISLRPENLESTRGTSGQPCAMLTNYFQLQVRESKPFYQYHVTFNPPVSTAYDIHHAHAQTVTYACSIFYTVHYYVLLGQTIK